MARMVTVADSRRSGSSVKSRMRHTVTKTRTPGRECTEVAYSCLSQRLGFRSARPHRSPLARGRQ
eukprot:2394498-Rhodomonas_salina.1